MKYSIYTTFLSLCALTSANPSAPSNALHSFELSFIASLTPTYSHPNTTLKLIGHKTITIPDEERSSFDSHYRKNRHIFKNEVKNMYYDSKAGTLRVYFPVKDALIEHGGKLIDAGESGEMSVSAEEILNGGGECHVVGRKKTDNVHGVEGNIIKDGIIYLEKPNRPTHNHDNVFVYDFGIKVVHDHSHDEHELRLKARDGEVSEEEAAKLKIRAVSCINNHGGPNCSNKFGIKKGRCPFNARICMDFNGIFTNCVNAAPKSYRGIRNFVGSDCQIAMSRGHCWNEYM